MAEQRIDSVYDLQAIEAQQKATQALVQKTVDDIKKAKELSIDFNINTKTIADFNKKIKELETQLAKVQKSSDAVTKSAILSSKAQEADAKARTANAKAAQEEEKATAKATKAKQIETAVIKNAEKEKEKLLKQAEREKKLLADAENDYLQLSKAYNEAALKAKNLTLALGENHPVTIQSVADARALGDILKKVDGSVGQFQRNVGNYTQATHALNQVIREAPAFANSFATGISAISNNLPMLLDQFKLLRAEVGSNMKALKILGGGLLSFNALLPIAFLLIQSFGKEIAGFVKGLFGAADASEALIKQLDNLRSQGDITKKTIEDLAKQAEFLQKLGDVTIDINFTDNFERSILRARTQMSGLIEDAGFLEQKLIEAKENDSKAFNAFQENATRAAKEMVAAFPGAAREIPDQLIETFSDFDKKLLTTIKSTSGAINDIWTRQTENDRKRTVLAAEIRLLKIDEERRKVKEAADKADKDAKERLRKRLEFLEKERKAEFDIIKANIELDKEFDLVRANDQQRSFINRLTNLTTYGEDSKRLIEAQAAFELNNSKLTTTERLRVENDKNNALIRLAKELNDKLKALAIEQAKAFEVGADRPGTTSKLPSGIQKALDDFQKAQDKAIKDAEKNAEKLKEAYKKAFESLSTELQGLFFDVFQNGFERQKNAIQDQIDLLEAQKQKDIEVANQTITNAQDRADAISVIEARAAAKRQQLELRQRQLDQQKARFEKAQAVAGIIQSTSLAVAKSLPNLGLAALVAAIGAIQLVRAIAQPIPRYAEGTDNHPGGKAIVGDGGKSEAVVMPDGSIYRTPATSTVVDLPAGTKVYPDYDKMMINATMTKVPVFNVKVDNNSNELRQGFKSIVKAVKSIPQPIIHAERAWTQAHKIGSNFRNYINRSI